MSVQTMDSHSQVKSAATNLYVSLSERSSKVNLHFMSHIYCATKNVLYTIKVHNEIADMFFPLLIQILYMYFRYPLLLSLV